MKLFGKKTLAMVLAVVMVMGMSVTAWATEVTPVAVTGVTVSGNSTVDVGATINLTATVAPENATDKTVTWATSDSAVATVADGVVTGRKAGTATITATAGGKSGTKDITVNMTSAAVLTGISFKDNDAVTVPYGISASKAADALKDKKIVLTYDQGTKEVTANWTFAGTTFDSATIGATNAFKPTLSNVPDNVTVPTFNVTVGKAGFATSTSDEVGTMTVLLGIEEKDLYLPTEVSVALNNGKAVSFSIGDSTSGDVDGLFDDWTSATYNDDKTGTYTFTADWKGASDARYDLGDLTMKVTVVDSDFELEAGYNGKSLKDTAEKIDELLKGMYGYGLYSITFDDLELDGGDLYILDEDDVYVEADDDTYEEDEFAAMYYFPNGSGEKSYIEYTAYTDDEDEDESISGTIEFDSEPFLLLDYELTTDDILELSVSDFQDKFDDWNDDDHEAVYVTFSSMGSNEGDLYEEYDEDDNDDEDFSSSTKYYFDPESKQLGINDLTYVPGKKTSGIVEVNFKVYGLKEGKGSAKFLVDGILRFNVTELADVTIEVAKNGTVEIDASLFEDFLDDNDKTFTEVVYVVFEGAPNDKLTSSSGKGCLEYDDDRISAPDGKKFFWIEDKNYDEDDDYLMDDVVFAGGKKDGTTRATFTVYGYKSSSNEKNERTSSLGSGSIDFVVGNANGSSNTLNGAIRGSETMKFAASLSAFEELGGRENEYITFTSLPVGGKLVYGWGTSAQEDVKAGTAYYLDYSAGKKTLSNVTFVPSYSSSKVQKTITIPFKAFNDKDRSVDGTINVTVTYSSYSTKFSDITTSTYADSVDFLYNQGITTGATASTFAPNNNVKRAEFVTFLWRAAGSPTVYGVTNKFTDVSASGQFGYAYNAILWAVQNGITTGRTSTTFAPGANVTHQELLTFLYRYDVNYLKHASNVSSYVNYTDWSSVQAYAQTPVKWADYKGILTGYAIQPNTPGTRATVALWLHRMLTL